MKTLLFILCLGSSISIQANTMNRFEGEEKEELISLNSELSELNVEELEQRLETDPLAVGGLLDLASPSDPTLLSTNITGCDKTCNGFQIG